MNNYNEVKKSFGTQAEKFASYHMSKAEYTDYLIRPYCLVTLSKSY